MSVNIEESRRYYATKLENEVRQLEVYRKRNHDAILRYKNLENRNSEPVQNKINSLEQAILAYEQEIKTKTEEEEKIRLGENDEYIKTQTNLNKAVQSQQKKTIDKKKQDLLDEKRELQEVFDDRSTKLNKSYREERYFEKDIKKDYERYVSKCETVPEYMSRKLKDMPGNKGYIFRGIWFFGQRPDERGKPLTMFERRGKDLIIHEYDQYNYNLYEKHGEQKQVLVSTTPRKGYKLSAYRSV